MQQLSNLLLVMFVKIWKRARCLGHVFKIELFWFKKDGGSSYLSDTLLSEVLLVSVELVIEKGPSNQKYQIQAEIVPGLINPLHNATKISAVILSRNFDN